MTRIFDFFPILKKYLHCFDIFYTEKKNREVRGVVHITYLKHILKENGVFLLK